MCLHSCSSRFFYGIALSEAVVRRKLAVKISLLVKVAQEAIAAHRFAMNMAYCGQDCLLLRISPFSPAIVSPM